jgi:NAD(P)-dependent dehydrogenase (short-subunit alcohol dehydrogenase family)
MSITDIRLDGQVAIITGSGRGLGAEYAKLLAWKGASIVVNDAGVSLDGTGADHNVADTVVSLIKSSGGKAVSNYENIETINGCKKLVDFALESFGRIDVLINNAGLLRFVPIEEVDRSLFERFVKVSVEAPFWLSQAVFPHMKSQRYGRIIFTTSGRAMYPEAALPGLSAYCVGKAAQVGLMNALAAEGREYGIKVNAISPVAATRMLQRTVERDTFRPEQVAPAVVFLAARECKFSGRVIFAGNGKFRVDRWVPGKEFSFKNQVPTIEQLDELWKEIS